MVEDDGDLSKEDGYLMERDPKFDKWVERLGGRLFTD